MRVDNHGQHNGKKPGLIARYRQMGPFLPWFETVVLTYVTVTLVVQVLFQISPVVTLFAHSPFYSIQTWLGLLGGLLIAIDLFTNKTLWRGKYSYFLFGILALAALASLRMIDYGLKENLYKLCWAAIQFALVYSLAWRSNRATIKRHFLIVYGVMLCIWVLACCVSLYQYVAQIGYLQVVNPLSADSSATRQGFCDNRLFGIFYTLNHAAYISLMLFLIGIFCVIKAKRKRVKCVILLTEVILLCHILLSGSRSAYLSLLTCTLCIAWMLTRNACKDPGWWGEVKPILLAVLILLLTIGGTNGLKAVLAEVPALCHETLEDMGLLGDGEVEDDLLQREDLEVDQSNGRFNIWKDYIALYDEVGLVGLSPGSYMSYIYENHPDLYIVEYIRQHYPDKYASGIIYHVHNGYIMVYVSSGILGLLLLVAFVVLCVSRVLGNMKGNRRVSGFFVCSMALVTAGAISAIFDEGLFFQNNPHTTIFWLALGFLMREAFFSKEHWQA